MEIHFSLTLYLKNEITEQQDKVVEKTLFQKQREGDGSVRKRRLARLDGDDDHSSVSSRSKHGSSRESSPADGTQTSFLSIKKESMQKRQRQEREEERQLLAKEREKRIQEREERAERRKEAKEELIQQKRQQSGKTMDEGQFEQLIEKFQEILTTKQYEGIGSKLLPKPYAGKLEENVYQFVNVCQRTAERMFGPHRIDNFLRVFPGLLIDNAQAWYTSHNIDKIRTWEQVKTAFLKYFDRLTEAEKVALQYKPMGKTQKIEDFISDFDGRMMKLNIKPDEALKIFTSTLTPYYRSRVSYEPSPTDLAEAQKRALTAKGEIEDIQFMINNKDTDLRALNDTLKDLVSTTSKTKLNPSANVATSEVTCYQCGQTGHFKANCLANVKKPYNNNFGRGRFNSNFAKRGGNQFGGKFKSSFNKRPGTPIPSRNGIKCHRCGKVGHIKANCRVNLNNGRGRFPTTPNYSSNYNSTPFNTANVANPGFCYMTPALPTPSATDRLAIKPAEVTGNTAIPATQAPSTAPCYVMYSPPPMHN